MSAATPASPVRSADELREEMVTTLVEKNAVRSPEIIRALRAVPRHLVEGPAGRVDVERVYDAFNVTLKKTGSDGVSISSVSAPQIQAYQLEQAQVRPGQRVLEVGSGGVNAAYLAELVGPDGLVVTMDIDEEITARATKFLTATGYPQVKVITGDAGFGAASYGPFDLILVTVEITDIPQAWWQQLSDNGRLVAPIRWRGQRRSVALARQGPDIMVADDIAQAGFVPMQGDGEYRERSAVLHEAPGQRVALRLDDGMSVDAQALAHSLRGEPAHRWTGVMVPDKRSYTLVDLWLSTVLDVAVLTGDAGAHEAGLIPRPSPAGIGWPTLVEGSSMAYRTLRATDTEDRWELGIIAHGPAGADLSERYAAALLAWDPKARPRLTVTRHHDQLPAPLETVHRSVRRNTSTFTISWARPPARCGAR
jgi:protein-L-isoaspartate(D-aspartate) O-methyltransferase